MKALSSDEKNNETITSLLKRMKTTSYAKFDAHKRYDRLNKSSFLALTISSLLLIFISIINKYSVYQIVSQEKTELFSILVSITVLILSLIVSLSSYSLKSERYLRTGNDILDLIDRLKLLPSIDGLNKIQMEYSILRKSSDNHQTYNYSRGRVERKNEERKEGEDEYNVAFYDNYCYWLPIIFFKFITLLSLAAFLIYMMSYFLLC